MKLSRIIVAGIFSLFLSTSAFAGTGWISNIRVEPNSNYNGTPALKTTLNIHVNGYQYKTIKVCIRIVKNGHYKTLNYFAFTPPYPNCTFNNRSFFLFKSYLGSAQNQFTINPRNHIILFTDFVELGERIFNNQSISQAGFMGIKKS